jgi:hypothetical protein
MIYCPKCGEQLPDDALYCSRCGQKLSEPVQVEPTGPTESATRRAERAEERIKERIERRREEMGPDYLDGVGFGVFLIVVAWTYIQFPSVFSNFLRWFETWTNGPTILPFTLVEPIALFFTLMGAWGIVEGAIRSASGRIGKGIGNIVGGFMSLALAYMFRSYGAGTLAPSALLPAFIIIIGASILVSALLRSLSHM